MLKQVSPIVEALNIYNNHLYLRRNAVSPMFDHLLKPLSIRFVHTFHVRDNPGRQIPQATDP